MSHQSGGRRPESTVHEVGVSVALADDHYVPFAVGCSNQRLDPVRGRASARDSLPEECRHAHLSLYVLHAVFSIGVRYEAGQAVVVRCGA
jgi:hypothetical protein